MSIRGNSTFQKKDLKLEKEYNDDYIALHYGKTYKVDKIDNNYNFYVSKKFYKENQIVEALDTILVSTSETLQDLGHSYIYNTEDFGLLGGEQILLKANEKIILKEYLYYLSKGLKKQLIKYAIGMKVYRFKIADFNYIEVDIPSLEQQQKIIDIIKQEEHLFLKYSNIVRIDTIENCKNDMKDLIDIIKPIEDMIKKIDNEIKIIKNLLVKKYKTTKANRVFISDYIDLYSKKYDEQEKYLATNAIGEFSIDITKVQDITQNKPSRANLTPEDNSIIISKLDGENKIMYVDNNFEYVLSTGFLNFTSEHLDSIVGFLLSEDFIKQKTLLSTGTTMIGLNNKELKKVKMNEPDSKNDEMVKVLNAIIKIKGKLVYLMNSNINLLIK